MLELCDPEEVDRRCKEDQAVLRKELEDKGELAAEIEKRGYLPRTDCLVPQPEILEKWGIKWPE